MSTPAARMLADYMLVLERNAPDLDPETLDRLGNAVQAMLTACLAPTAERMSVSRDQINFTLMERVRKPFAGT